MSQSREIKKSVAVALIVACGTKTADRWGLPRLEKKLNDLASVSEETIKALTGENKKWADRILKALKNEDKITVVADAPADDKSKDKPESKGKGKGGSTAAKDKDDKKDDKKDKPAKAKVDRDGWGSKVGTSCGDINLCIPPKGTFTVKDIHEKVSLKNREVRINRVRDHIRSLCKKHDKLEQVKDGYRIKKGAGNPANNDAAKARKKALLDGTAKS